MLARQDRRKIPELFLKFEFEFVRAADAFGRTGGVGRCGRQRSGGDGSRRAAAGAPSWSGPINIEHFLLALARSFLR